MKPKLTSEELAVFIGGQIEIQNQLEGYIYRGEIKTAVVEKNEILITLNWMAKGIGYPPIPTKWIADKTLRYAANLQIYSVNDIGPGTEGDNRLCLQSSVVGEVTVLYPPNGSKLDPVKVKGLILSST